MGISDKLRLITVEPILFLFMLGNFTQISVFQDLIYTKVCLHSIYRNSCSDLHNQSLNYVQQESSHWVLYTNLAFSLPAIFSSLYLGSWCCLFGPKLPLIFSLVGTIIGLAINIGLSIYMDTHVAYLLISQFVSGVTGASICVIMSCTTYLALIVTLENRTSRFSILESMIFLGGFIGPFIGGPLKAHTSHAVVFTYLLCLSLITLFYSALRMRNVRAEDQQENNQSLDKDSEHEVRIVEKKVTLFNIRHCFDTVVVCFRQRSGHTRLFILLLLFCAFLVMTCTAGVTDVSLIFTKDDPLNWDYKRFSYYSGVQKCLNGLALLIVAPTLRRFFNLKDTSIALLGITSKMLGLILLAFSVNNFMMFTVPIIYCLSGFPIPVLRSMLSKLMEPNEHGKLFAFVATIEQLCYLVAAVIFNALYPATRSFFHGFVFLLCAAFLLIALAILFWIHVFTRRQNVESLHSNSTSGYRKIEDDS